MFDLYGGSNSLQFSFDGSKYLVGMLALICTPTRSGKLVADGFDAGDMHFVTQVLNLLDEVDVGLLIIPIAVFVRAGTNARELFLPIAEGGRGNAYEFRDLVDRKQHFM